MPNSLKHLWEDKFLARGFLLAAVCVLTATGVAKIWSGTFGPHKFLIATEPITGLSFGHLLLAVGVVELVIAGICLFANSQTVKLGWIAWLATSFVIYRLGLWWIGWKKPCGCLGNITDALHISPQLADNLMKAILAYLLIGSYGLLFWQWRAGKAKMLGGALNVAVPKGPSPTLDVLGPS